MYWFFLSWSTNCRFSLIPKVPATKDYIYPPINVENWYNYLCVVLSISWIIKSLNNVLHFNGYLGKEANSSSSSSSLLQDGVADTCDIMGLLLRVFLWKKIIFIFVKLCECYSTHYVSSLLLMTSWKSFTFWEIPKKQAFWLVRNVNNAQITDLDDPEGWSSSSSSSESYEICRSRFVSRVCLDDLKKRAYKLVLSTFLV